MARFRRRGFKRRRIGRRRTYRRRFARRRFRRNLTRVGIGRPERKFIDTYLSSNAIPQSAITITPQLLTGVAQGTDNNQRIGRKIMLTNIQIRWVLNGVATGETTPIDTDLVRILIVRDLQYTGVNPPTLGDVLEDSGTSSSNFFVAFNDLKVQGNQRFRTMYDKIFAISTGTGQNYQLKYVKYYKKMRREIDFNGIASAPSSGGRNAIWLFMFKYANVATAVVTTDTAIRVRFTDV